VFLDSVTQKGAFKYLFGMNTKKKFKALDTEDQMKKLGNRIRGLRKAKGYTSAETFAYENGFARAMYGRYENGKNIQFITLVRLANCFEIALDEFFSEGFD